MKTTSCNSAGLFFLLAIGLISYTGAFSQGQDSTRFFRIETRDGNQYVGKILEHTNDQMILQTEKLGVLTIRVIEIIKIDPVRSSQEKDEAYWFEHPQSTRYLWAPNGYGLKKGEGYYQNIWVLFNQFSVGVTDRISLGGGMIPLFLFAGAPTPAWITPKISVPLKENRINIGAGGLFGGVIGLEETGFGVLYGTLTVGGRDRNLSLGMGYGYAGGSWAYYPAISLSAMIRTGPRGYILTENYYLGGDGSNFLLLSIGGRRIIRKTGLDFGLLAPTGTGGTLVAIPWLGLTIPFGKKVRL